VRYRLAACLAMVPLIIAGSFFTRNGFNISVNVRIANRCLGVFRAAAAAQERPPLIHWPTGLGFFLLPFIMGYQLRCRSADNAAQILPARACRCAESTRSRQRRIMSGQSRRASHLAVALAVAPRPCSPGHVSRRAAVSRLQQRRGPCILSRRHSRHTCRLRW